MNAANFTGDSLREAIDKCRIYGGKTNITLNTLIHGREMYDVLKYAEELKMKNSKHLLQMLLK